MKNEMKNVNANIGTVKITIDHGAHRNRPRVSVFCDLKGHAPSTDVMVYESDSEAFCAAEAIRRTFALHGVDVRVKFGK